MTNTRLVVIALTVGLACLVLAFHTLVYEGWRGGLGGEWAPWTASWSREGTDGDEYMLGVGKADITGYVYTVSLCGNREK
jgi:hypothetical protein